MLVRLLILLLFASMSVPTAGAAEDSFGKTLKKIFSTPTPTPTPRKKKKSAAAKTSPTPTPSASPKKKTSPTPKEEKSPTPSATPSPKKKKSPPPEEATESPTPKKKRASPSPSPAESPHKKKKSSPTPEPSATPEGAASPGGTPSPTPAPESSPTPSPSPGEEKKHGAPNASLTPGEIKGFDDYPAPVQKILTTALELTTRNLEYKYGSADPASGGMDCSGFVYYVLKQNGIADVPRDSSSQYVWLRRAGAFEPVLSQKDDSFELENLKPGDLLFWTGTYAIERDPPITHAMIYVGREKKTGARVMVGSSDGRVYQAQSRNGVSVFDFKVQRRAKAEEGKLRPTFIGYGHLPKPAE